MKARLQSRPCSRFPHAPGVPACVLPRVRVFRGSFARRASAGGLGRPVSGSGIGSGRSISASFSVLWFSKLIGVDTDFRFAGRTNDPLKEFPDHPSAGTLHVYCEAANEAGPGIESATATIDLA